MAEEGVVKNTNKLKNINPDENFNEQNLKKNKMINYIINTDKKIGCMNSNQHNDLEKRDILVYNINLALKNYGPNSKIYIHNIISNILNQDEISVIEAYIIIVIIINIKNNNDSQVIYTDTLIFIIDKIHLINNVDQFKRSLLKYLFAEFEYVQDYCKLYINNYSLFIY